MTAVQERYARAVRSSHLECTETSQDIDALIAAGMVRESIGVDLLRLRVDHDSISRLPGGRVGARMLARMPYTMERLERFVVSMAEREALTATPGEMQALCLRVMDLFLSPNCEPCGGTGEVGQVGAARMMCPTCRGRRQRTLKWRDDETARFVRLVQYTMEEKIETASRRIRRLLKHS